MTRPGAGLAWHVDLAPIERGRVLRGWARRELARRAHVDPGTVSDLFRGRRRPTLGTLQALCVAVGLELADVIAFEPAPGRDERDTHELVSLISRTA